MKTIILGFKDERGESNPVLVCGPDVAPAKQAEVFSAAKNHHDFPDGLKRVDQCTFESIGTAIFIDANTATTSKQRRESELKRESDAKAEREAAIKAKAEIVRLESAVNESAKARNVVLGQQNTLRVKIRNLGLSNAAPKAIEEANAELKKVDVTVAAAVSAYEKAVVDLAKLKKPDTNPKTTNTIAV